ncbi:hypothetical protein HN670_00715 [bacterium]|jgi:hypothetical protein|nr:hypothetical protein [bacterium]
MTNEKRNALISQYAKLALANMKENDTPEPTPEMIEIQKALDRTHEAIMIEHHNTTVEKL